ncbi:MAG: hypothetical protein B7Y41_05260 [Hydrogenophilales bacterium 28-61-23]|nr:MAG: hypothetical protein B7Y41_05260 [Hydrogenophilales bacterium 28-61-23]
MRGRRIFLAALMFSLLAHLIGLGSSRLWWRMPAVEAPFPIEAHLELAAEPTPPETKSADLPSAVKTVSPSVKRQAAVKPIPSAEPRHSASTPEAASLPLESPQPSAPLSEQPVDQPDASSRPDVPAAADPMPPATPPRPLRALPAHIALRYDMQTGEDGFIVGRTTYSGQIRDGRYALMSVTEATGITSLFVSGKIIQTSEGRVTENGLLPELFWLSKGKRRQPPIRFDWSRQRLMLPAGGVELPAQAQDLLSFPFHIAMRVGEADAEWTLPITNGKKLREYVFRVLGREPLTLGNHQIETLRLQGSRVGEGSLDVWLAPARDWLPVRIRMLDQEGKAIVLTLRDGAD